MAADKGRAPPARSRSGFASAKAGRRAVAGDEAKLWRRAMREVRPLAGRATPPTVEIEDEPAPAPVEPTRKPPAGARRPPPLPTSALPDLDPASAPGLDKRTAARLRRGQIPIEAEIDLHGLTQAEAHRALAAFIAAARAEGRRCLLVITGKGLGPGGRVGVLRAAVPRWLNEAALRPHVLALARAGARHGAEGALYVLLRKPS